MKSGFRSPLHRTLRPVSRRSDPRFHSAVLSPAVTRAMRRAIAPHHRYTQPNYRIETGPTSARELTDALAAGFGYVYGQHCAPHDIQVRDFGTGKSRLSAAKQLGLTFRVCPA